MLFHGGETIGVEIGAVAAASTPPHHNYDADNRLNDSIHVDNRLMMSRSISETRSIVRWVFHFADCADLPSICGRSTAPHLSCPRYLSDSPAESRFAAIGRRCERSNNGATCPALDLLALGHLGLDACRKRAARHRRYLTEERRLDRLCPSNARGTHIGFILKSGGDAHAGPFSTQGQRSGSR